MKHIISVLVENKFGVLARIAGLFSARGFNIDSLAVSETEDATISRMTIVVNGDNKILEQVKKQLNKLIDVISVKEFAKQEHIDRELLLFKVSVDKKNKDKVIELLKRSGAAIVKAVDDAIIVEVVCDPGQTKELLGKLEEYGIKEMVRTGRIAMSL